MYRISKWRLKVFEKLAYVTNKIALNLGCIRLRDDVI